MTSIKHLPLPALLCIAALSTVFNSPLFAADIETLLKQTQPPEGVVFEIASSDRNTLRRVIPVAQMHIKQLRARFPDLDIAIVTHGKEQFSLTRDNKEKFSDLHRNIQSLVKNTKVPVHVCETYANWNNIDANAFPDYVDVAAAGPAQINDYRKLGYTLIKLN